MLPGDDEKVGSIQLGSCANASLYTNAQAPGIAADARWGFGCSVGLMKYRPVLRVCSLVSETTKPANP